MRPGFRAFRRFAAALAALPSLFGAPSRAAEAQGMTVGSAVEMLNANPGQSVRAASYLSCALSEACHCALPVAGTYVGYVVADSLECFPQANGSSVDYQRLNIAVDGPSMTFSVSAPPYLNGLERTTAECAYDAQSGAMGLSADQVYVLVGLCPFNFGFDVALEFAPDGKSFTGTLLGLGTYQNPLNLFCRNIPSPCDAAMTIHGFRFP